jgi:hypothetical protein
MIVHVILGKRAAARHLQQRASSRHPRHARRG